MKQNWQQLTRSYSVWDDNNIKGFFGQYRWLSNFELTDVAFEGDVYPSSEHAFMAAKTLNRHERIPLMLIPASREGEDSVSFMSASDAKAYGRSVKLRDNWDNLKKDFMRAILLDKFGRNLELRQKLIDTGDKYLEETNHWGDTYWGVDYQTESGQNNLGKLLMEVREFYKNNP